MQAARPLLVPLVLGIAACGAPAPDPGAPDDPAEAAASGAQEATVAGPVAYETRVLRRTSEGCGEEAVDGEPGPCAEVRLSWPEISAAPTPEAAERLREWVLATLLVAPMGAEPEAGSPEAHAEEFLAGFQEYRAEFPDAPAGWFDRRSVEVVHQDRGVVSFRFSEQVYSGGAHPSSAVTLASFDPESGRPLRLDDLLAQGYRDRLREIGERRFREARGLAPEASLQEAGFWFEEGFALNDNWAVDEPGIVFHWDPYEVAPYAAGATEIVLTLEDLEGLVDPEGPLAR